MIMTIYDNGEFLVATVNTNTPLFSGSPMSGKAIGFLLLLKRLLKHSLIMISRIS